jgi:hypothetical protein
LTAEGTSSYQAQSSVGREAAEAKKKVPAPEDDFQTLNPYQVIRKYIPHEVYKTNLRRT